MKQITPFYMLLFILLFAVQSPASGSGYMHSRLDSQHSLQQEVLHHINQYRITHGLSRLTMDPLLSQEATQHSLDMAHHKVPFGHSQFNDRMHRVYQHIQYATGGAENVAYNYKSAPEVVEQWLHSPGHRKNIQGNYNLTGIGIVRDAQGRLYYTQLFVRTASPNHHQHIREKHGRQLLIPTVRLSS